VLYSRRFWVIAIIYISCRCGLPKWHSGKESPANAGDTREVGSVPGSGRSPRAGNRNSLQYSDLENSMDGGSMESQRVRHNSRLCLSQAPKVSLPQHFSSGNHKLVFDIHKSVSVL